MTPDVVLHTDETGNITVYADKGVRVVWCSDLAPNDRMYQADPAPIPDGLLDGYMGFSGDRSPPAARASRAIREAYGLPMLDVVPDTTEDDPRS